MSAKQSVTAVYLYKGKYWTPRGVRWLSVKAISVEVARALLKNKTPWKAGWVLEGGS